MRKVLFLFGILFAIMFLLCSIKDNYKPIDIFKWTYVHYIEHVGKVYNNKINKKNNKILKTKAKDKKENKNLNKNFTLQN